MSLSESFMTSMAPLLAHTETFVAAMAARAIAGGMKIHPHLCRDVIDELVRLFVEAQPEQDDRALPRPPEKIKGNAGERKYTHLHK